MNEKIKISINLFFDRPIMLNFYKSISQFFVRLNKQQRKYFGHVFFLPTKRTAKEQNDYEKKLCEIVPLNARDAHYLMKINR